MTEMTVLFPEKSRWAFRRPPELDPDAVTTWLRPLFPNLALPNASHPEVELIYSAERIFVQCSVYAGRHGIRAVHTEIHDADRDQPAEGYLSKLPTVIDPLQGLARATGARFLVEGEDMTDATSAQVVKRVT